MPSITPVTILTEAATNKVFSPSNFNADMASLETAINALIAYLESTSSGTSGSDYVQCRAIEGINSNLGASLNTILGAFKDYVDTQDDNLTVGAVPDGSITPAKLSFDVYTEAEIDALLEGIQLEVTGAASTIIDSNLNASKVLVSNADGKVASSTLASSILSYLSGLTADVQTQLNAKQATILGAASTIVTNNLTPARVLATDGNGKVAETGITVSEINQLSGIIWSVQGQLNELMSGKQAASSASTAELNHLVGVTSLIQTQLNGKLGSTAQAVDSLKVNGQKITVAADAPSGPAVNDVWIDI